MEEATPSEKSFLLSEGYTVKKKLGQGSYSKVFVCEPVSSDPNVIYECVACKIVNLNSLEKEYGDYVTKFFPRELSILRKLKHPNIINLYAIYKKHSTFFFIMRLAENKDLLEYVISEGEVAENLARFWAWQIGSALSYMHSQDIVHRDLKCENVLLTENMNAKICDFGFAKILTKNSGFIEMSKTFCGSKAYAAPEVLERKPYNPKLSDPWSLGVVIYVILSRTLPFQGNEYRSMLAAQKVRLRFIGRAWDIVSQQAKSTIVGLLDVDPLTRMTTDSMLRSSWFSMDPRLIELNLDIIKSRGERQKAKKYKKRADNSYVFEGSPDNRSINYFKKNINRD